jgi:hypothetical protein
MGPGFQGLKPLATSARPPGEGGGPRLVPELSGQARGWASS